MKTTLIFRGYLLSLVGYDDGKVKLVETKSLSGVTTQDPEMWTFRGDTAQLDRGPLMAIAGGAVPTLLLTLQMRVDVMRLKVASAGSKSKDVVVEDIGVICDRLQSQQQVYANATNNRLMRVEEELRRRGVEFILWQW